MAAVRILIVDSEEQVRRLLSRVLARAGYEVESATGPVEAMEICRRVSIDLVLADAGWMRPDGHDLAWWLAAERPATRVLLMAAWESECGSCAYLSQCEVIRKPFEVKAVLASVAAALGPPA